MTNPRELEPIDPASFPARVGVTGHREGIRSRYRLDPDRIVVGVEATPLAPPGGPESGVDAGAFRSRIGRGTVVVAAAVGIVLATVGVYLFFLAPAKFTIPSGASGTECIGGVKHDYMTTPGPAYDQHSNVTFDLVDFELWYHVTFSSGAGDRFVNGSDPTTPNATLYLVDGLIEVTTSQTVLSLNGHFGAQVWQTNVTEVRLLVSPRYYNIHP
jgi:hypothetical protein